MHKDPRFPSKAGRAGEPELGAILLKGKMARKGAQSTLIHTNFGVSLELYLWDMAEGFRRPRYPQGMGESYPEGQVCGISLYILTPCCSVRPALRGERRTEMFAFCWRCNREYPQVDQNLGTSLDGWKCTWPLQFLANVRILATSGAHGLDPLALELFVPALETFTMMSPRNHFLGRSQTREVMLA